MTAPVHVRSDDQIIQSVRAGYDTAAKLRKLYSVDDLPSAGSGYRQMERQLQRLRKANRLAFDQGKWSVVE